MSKRRRCIDSKAKDHEDIVHAPGRVIVFGRKPVLELLRHKTQQIECMYMQQGIQLDTEFKLLLSAPQTFAIQEGLSCEEMINFSGSNNHQGVACVLKKQKELLLGELIARSQLRNKLLVICDQIADPQNLGAIMRVAESAGADGVIVTTDRSAPITQVVMRASAGACQFLPVVQVKNLQRTLKELKEAGFWTVGLDKNDNAKQLYDTRIPTPTAIILGSEGKGIRRLTAKECDLIVAIPMAGFIESLNVSQAASVVLYELVRRKLSNFA